MDDSKTEKIAKPTVPQMKDQRTEPISHDSVLASGKGSIATGAVMCAKVEIGSRLQAVAANVLRYGLVLVIGWIAAMKATEYEAKGIQPLIAHSPFLSWGYNIWTVRQFGAGIGAAELAIAILIALRHWYPKACAIGSAAAALMFLTTLSFLFSTPGWEPTLGGFPALSGDVGEFLVKDIVLLGAALWSLGEALTGIETSRQPARCTRQKIATLSN